MVEASIRQAFIEELEAQGALILNPSQAEYFAGQVFDEQGHLRRSLVGKSASYIAQFAGLPHQTDVRLIVALAGPEALSGPLGHEKLAPILSLFTVTGEAEGLRICRQILKNQGRGHTAIVHTQDQKLAERFGFAMPASRILVNSPGSQGCIGLGNGLTPSLTLGCGTFGGNSTTDNVSYTHLLNIKRLALGI